MKYYPKERDLIHKLIDKINDIAFIIKNDKSFSIELVNDAAIKHFDINDTVIGSSVLTLYPENKANFLCAKYRDASLSTNEISFEDDYINCKKGKQLVNRSLLPLFNESNECTHILEIVKDITNEKHDQISIDNLETKKQMYQSLFEYNSDAIFTIDLNGLIQNGNLSSKSLFSECPYNRLKGTDYQKLITPEDIIKAETCFRQASKGDSDSTILRILNHAGEQMIANVTFSPIVISDKVVGVYSIFRDVTTHVKMVEKYMESENKFRIIAENSSDLITLINNKGLISYVSPSYQDILGFNFKNYVGSHFTHNIHPDYINELISSFQEAIYNKTNWNAEFQQKHSNGNWIWSELHGTPVFDEENGFMYMVVLSRDITLRKEHEAHLKHFAYHDSLTGLPNRRLFSKKLNDALVTQKVPLAVMIIDIDHFKTINDMLGHDVGDYVIEEFAKRIQKNLTKADMAARLGGDEFVILLPELIASEHVLTLVENIRKCITAPWHISGEKLTVTASIGIALAKTTGLTKHTLLKNADLALYEAKNAGRNTYKTKELSSHK